MTYFSTMSDRWLTVCHIIFWVISVAQLLHFQHWYIIILWFYCIIHLLKQFIITVSQFCQDISSCWFWTHFVSLRSRFLFLLQITISAQQRMVHSFICCQVFIFTRSFALFSVMCAEAPPFRLLHHYTSRLFSCSACAEVFYHSFWVARSFIYSFTHSFIHFCMSCLVWFDWFIHSFTHSFIHSLTHSFIHSLIHSSIHWLIEWVSDCYASRCG